MKSLIILQRVKGLINFSGLRGCQGPGPKSALAFDSTKLIKNFLLHYASFSIDNQKTIILRPMTAFESGKDLAFLPRRQERMRPPLS
jgi:hypothetical protein